MIIYPPLVKNTMPAFIFNENTKKVTIKVPFEWNPGVSYEEVVGINLQIKDYLTSKIIYNIVTSNQQQFKEDKFALFEIQIDDNNTIENFPLIGQYYKFQIAYQDSLNQDSNNLVYSSVVLGRCISEPEKLIIISQQDNINYMGVYKAPMNSESLYSYRFELLEETTLLQDTGIVYFTDYANVVNNEYKISFQLKWILDAGINYTLKFTITTINGYTQTISEAIVKTEEIASQHTFNWLLENDYENGYINIKLTNPNTLTAAADFVIQRKTQNENYWQNLFNFSVNTTTILNTLSWKDFTVEQGQLYYYQIKEIINDNIYSQTITSSSIISDFDYMFLSDNEVQLKIKFNPQISSFKTIVLESKVDTIGSKYPFFFRNNQVDYKEFPISGLLSYLADENEYFLKYEELNLNNMNIPTTNLVNYNIFAEKNFKLKALEWLNNGKLKLFRSPTEGNYVVRLMNISMTPIDTLGRMLHTFSCTAYESTSSDLNSLIEQNLIFKPKEEQK